LLTVTVPDGGTVTIAPSPFVLSITACPVLGPVMLTSPLISSGSSVIPYSPARSEMFEGDG
jgi:hypothetical protein